MGFYSQKCIWELNILYSQALKSLPFIFRNPGEIFWTVRWGFVLREYYSPRNPNPKTWSFFVFIRIWSNGFLCTGCTAYFPPSLPDVDLMPSKLPLSLNAPQYLSSIPFVNSHTIKSKQNFGYPWIGEREGVSRVEISRHCRDRRSRRKFASCV